MINNGGMGNAMETKSLLEAFRSAGDVAFDCRHYLEWEQAKNKGETTQTESLFLSGVPVQSLRLLHLKHWTEHVLQDRIR